jgi:hypothetical protein
LASLGFGSVCFGGSTFPWFIMSTARCCCCCWCRARNGCWGQYLGNAGVRGQGWRWVGRWATADAMA